MAADGATYAQFAACDAVCQDSGATTMELANCIDETDAFNNSGDGVMAPWDPPGPANDRPCQQAFATACTVLVPGTCAAP
jgi:hypothetical protein